MADDLRKIRQVKLNMLRDNKKENTMHFDLTNCTEFEIISFKKVIGPAMEKHWRMHTALVNVLHAG